MVGVATPGVVEWTIMTEPLATGGELLMTSLLPFVPIDLGAPLLHGGIMEIVMATDLAETGETTTTERGTTLRGTPLQYVALPHLTTAPRPHIEETTRQGEMKSHQEDFLLLLMAVARLGKAAEMITGNTLLVKTSIMVLLREEVPPLRGKMAPRRIATSVVRK